ncbi:hypothetical protein SDC9_205981 [bioreactor metagenome]|uniref:Uncharacterized protein n=1 Tax=bioreactor metagenome TaxID=1076179 RepID=A0A645J3P9_9ZZZZ
MTAFFPGDLLVVIGVDGLRAVQNHAATAPALRAAGHRDEHIVTSRLEAVVQRLGVAGQAIIVADKNVERRRRRCQNRSQSGDCET